VRRRDKQNRVRPGSLHPAAKSRTCGGQKRRLQRNAETRRLQDVESDCWCRNRLRQASHPETTTPYRRVQPTPSLVKNVLKRSFRSGLLLKNRSYYQKTILLQVQRLLGSAIGTRECMTVTLRFTPLLPQAALSTGVNMAIPHPNFETSLVPL